MIANRLDSVASRITRHAMKAPHHTAVADGVRTLTYGELEQRSDALAARLQANGVERGEPVGVYLERSTHSVAAMLSIMKAGAAYVPIDIATPQARIRTILADAGAQAAVSLAERFQDLPAGLRFLIDVEDEGSAADSVAKPEIATDDIAYIIYTSGSTGQPKGVEITHGGLANLIDWHAAAFHVTADDRASQVANLGFDASVWEVWPNLASGATIVIADELTRRSAQALHDWIVSEGITLCFAPTAIAEQLIRGSWPAETALRVLLTGGDVLRHRPLPETPFAVVNNYGPTECTVVATSGVVTPDANPTRRPSIGRPITNAYILVLDEDLQPVPTGEAGELCIAGVLVGRGYHNLPELTASQFVVYASVTGELVRIYRTRDQARVLPNGDVEFLGRLDEQVKIRGHRIELGEVSSALRRVNGVAAGVVAVRDMGEVGPALVGYIVPSGEVPLDVSALREALAVDLPDYMIPGFFVAVPGIPTGSRGEPDLASLPAPDAQNLLAGKQPMLNGHANGVQQRVGALVASMLGRPSVGTDENFFMIGGHSMLGVELVARLRETFGVRLTLRQLFKAPTVAALAAEVSQQTEQS
ncbi:MAG TPA: non-ribosomal peptide synthetase [Candidatus Acidoferrales bacterium]|nr:non-ribosomal peptide synthetase [Candidatus Acidoferrales bacterium]